MRLFDKLLNRKIKGRLETDDGINAENVIKKSNNIQTAVSYENNTVNIDSGIHINNGRPITFVKTGVDNLLATDFIVLSNSLPAGETTEIVDYSGEPFTALIFSAGGGVAVVSNDGVNTGTLYTINADSNITINASTGVLYITTVNSSFVSTMIFARTMV